MPEAPYKPIKKPKIFLVLSGLMLLVTIISYVFEEELYDLNHSSGLFVLLISGSLVLALFFLTCYRVPRLGLKILGRESELGYKKPSEGGVSFNVFKTIDTAEEKIQSSARKQTRQTRRSFKNQKVQVPSDDDTKNEDDSADKPS